MTLNFNLNIADTIISLIAEDRMSLIEENSTYRLFLSEGRAEVTLRFHDDSGFKRDRTVPREIIFDSHPSWRLFYSDRNYILETRAHTLIASPDFTSGEVYVDKKRGMLPFAYPLDEVLMINLLGKGRGILTHACGVKNSRVGGLLFAATSGGGKSTIANLWKCRSELGVNRQPSAVKKNTVLSDDRIIVRKMNKGFWLYGTPWHGDAKMCSPEKVQLKKIFFLERASNNHIRELERVEAISKLLVRTFPPFWDRKGMEFTVRFIEELTAKVPCYDLGFFPDKKAIDFIESI